MTDIQQFYNGSTIFLTGATGFVGKLVLEKLLRTCHDLRRVYVLIREKKNKSSEQRFAELFDAPLWSRLKQQYPNFHQKISVIQGNCMERNLGLSDDDMEKLIIEVDVIMHCAATVRFNEEISKATKINVIAVQDLIQIAKRMHRLKAIVHVSTAYSNCIRKTIEEKFYEPSLSPDNLIQIIATFDHETLKQSTKRLLGDYPNTYTFTKNIGENVIMRDAKGLPVAIVRPSIIAGTYEEPIEGYIDKPFGFSGSVQGIAYGVLRCIYGDPEVKTDLIPCDYVANQIIAAAWLVGTGNNNQPNETRQILHCTSSDNKVFTVRDFVKRIVTLARTSVPSEQNIWYPLALVTPSRFWFEGFWFLFHTLPVKALSLIMFKQLSKRVLKLDRLYKKTHKLGVILGYFMLHQWEFNNSNTKSLIKQMSQEDQKMFNFDMRKVNWDRFIESQVRGVRIYLSDETPEGMEKGKSFMMKLKFYHYLFLIVLTMLPCTVITMIVKRIVLG